MDYQLLGRRIRVKRREKGLTQEEVAAKTNISISFYGNIERGLRSPSLETLVSIANALDCDMNCLLSDSLCTLKPQQNKDDRAILRKFFAEQLAELNFYEDSPSAPAPDGTDK